MINLSVVIITWNAKNFLIKCLESIYEKNPGFKFELIIIDNNSHDGTIEFIKSEYPDSILIENSENKGVAPARNQGLKIAKGKYVLILDVDTELLTQDAFSKMFDYMEQHTQTGIIGAKLLFSNGDLQHSCRNFPGVMLKIISRFENFSFIRNSSLLNEHYMMNADHTKIMEVDYVIGAFQLLRSELIQKIGVYDENIFYGPEDIDYCLRSKRAGYKTIYFPEVELYHHYQRITKKFFTKATFEHIKGLIYYFRKHAYFTKPKI